MPRQAICVMLVCMALAGPTNAQHLLPASFAAWDSTAANRVGPKGLERFLGEQAAVFQEFGLIGAESRTYTRGAESLKATVYQMHDPTAAYGAFTYLRSEDMTGGLLGEHSALAHERALVQIGNLLLDVSGRNLISLQPALKGLVADLYPKARIGPLPSLGQFLPAKGLVANSQCYLVGPLALNRFLPLGSGDWIGFADGAEVELARYRLEGQNLTLLLASYPTPQVAARKLEELGRWLPIHPTTKLAGGKQPLFARRSVTLVAILADAKSPDVAEAVLGSIRYASNVTWNEPGHSATDPTMADIVVGTIYATGAILMFAIFAGIGFGGVRLVVKHFLPGKVFDRPAHVEIIQLGINSKPIDANDFY